jgi:predicted house-cleaning noncanonical NTP pyrophosphatase (MazG superfamily)
MNANTPEKLVRDNIPQIVRAAGETPVFRIADDEDMPALLRQKLREEVAEYLESRQPEELVDVLEVAYALAQTAGISESTLDEMRMHKGQTRGRFHDRVVLQTPPLSVAEQRTREIADEKIVNYWRNYSNVDALHPFRPKPEPTSSLSDSFRALADEIESSTNFHPDERRALAAMGRFLANHREAIRFEESP